MKNFNKLVEIVATLRGPNGCPWDKKQTHESLLPFLFEESNEVADTIVSRDIPHLQEELGDTLLQIILHSQIAQENNDFSISDVINSICDKLIRRHPHIFGNVKAETENEVNRLWEQVKEEERKNITVKQESALDLVPKHFTAVLTSEKIQKEAARNGFDWEKEDIFPVLQKVKEEITEVEEAITEKNQKHIESEIGDLLFAVIHLAQHLDIDAETALFKCNQRFFQRFHLVELQAKKSGKQLKSFSLEELQQFWRHAKELLATSSYEEAIAQLE